MSEFNAVQMRAASPEELERIDGGLLAFFIGMGIGYGVTKAIKGSGGGGGEPLPGFNGFLAATKGISAAGRPQ